jgi:hypothetical protein
VGSLAGPSGSAIFADWGLEGGTSLGQYCQFFSRAVSARPLQDQTHRELVYRLLQFHKRRQHFIGAHNETLSVAA